MSGDGRPEHPLVLERDAPEPKQRARVMVGFATCDGKHVDAELRTAPRLDVYEVTTTAVRLQRTCAFAATGAGTGARIEALAGVELVYVCAIGPSVAARLASHRIRAATSGSRARIDVVLAHLHNVLRLAVRDARKRCGDAHGPVAAGARRCRCA